MIRLGGWCVRRSRGTAAPAGRRWESGGRAGQGGSRALRVLVDLDGVLADFEGGFLRKFRARFPDLPFIALEDRRGFWLSEQYGSLGPELSEKAISIWETKDFFFDLEPIPGAVEAVKQMASLENTDVFICTSPIKMYKYCPYEKHLPEKFSLLIRFASGFLNQALLAHLWVPPILDTERTQHLWRPLKAFLPASVLGSWGGPLCPGGLVQEGSWESPKYAWVEKHLGSDFLEHIVLTRDKTVVSADLLIDDRLDITGAEPNPNWEHIVFTACHNQHVQLPPPSRRLRSWEDDWKAILDSKRPR